MTNRIKHGTAMCFHQRCGLPWTEEVASGPSYYTRLCTGHKRELDVRAPIYGGYTALNAADADKRRPVELQNVWGWRLREDYHANWDNARLADG